LTLIYFYRRSHPSICVGIPHEKIGLPESSNTPRESVPITAAPKC
jgi:hypothetical protein